MDIERILEGKGVDFSPLTRQEAWQVEKRWLQQFASHVKQKTGRWISGGIKWHGFSHKLERALQGAAAMQAYQAQAVAEYYVFDETLSRCYLCRSDSYPDCTELLADMYIVPKSFKWTMVFTHEYPHIGSYFSQAR